MKLAIFRIASVDLFIGNALFGFFWLYLTARCDQLGLDVQCQFNRSGSVIKTQPRCALATQYAMSHLADLCLEGIDIVGCG
jgi:hypothetical protein